MNQAGVVRFWVDDEGWGVLDSAATPGGCWAHFSAVAIVGYRELLTGDRVDFEYEHADQDGFQFRAVRVWPDGTKPVDGGSEVAGAYASNLAIEFDRPN